MIGVIGAMDEEVAGLLEDLSHVTIKEKASLTFYQGRLADKDVVVVRCGIGKVNAALCTQMLIDDFRVKCIINTGVAGGLAGQVNLGDVVISTSAIHHDFDAGGFGYTKGVIPRLPVSEFPADQRMQDLALAAGKEVLADNRIHQGIIASGDQFIASSELKKGIYSTFKALCAEMEGAAIAQVCYLNQTPYVIIRAISDNADNSAPENWDAFVASIVPELNQIVNTSIKNMASYSVCSD